MLIAALVVAFVSLRAGGQLLVDRASKRATPPEQTSTFDPLVLAAALPGSRDRALDQLELVHRYGRTERAAKQRIALATMRRGCAGAAEQLVKEARYEDALRKSFQCGAVEARIAALLSLGRYDEAAGLMTPRNSSRDQRMRAMIATRRWQAAAAIVDEMHEGSSDELACFADLLRWFAGDSAAGARIVDRSARVVTEVCALCEALTKSVDPRTIVSRIRQPGSPRAADAAGRIAWMYGSIIEDRGDAVDALVRRRVHDVTIEPWLVSHASEARDSVSVRAWSVVREAYENAFGTAASEVDVIAADPRAGSSVALRLDRALALRGGSAIGEQDPSSDILAAASALRAGQVRDYWASEPIVSADCPRDTMSALTTAASGDGEQLAGLLETCRTYDAAALAVLAVGPRIQKHRERLAHVAARIFRRDEAELPFARVHDLAWSRDLARVLGDDVEAIRLQHVIDNHLRAFQLREQVVALVLWRAL